MLGLLGAAATPAEPWGPALSTFKSLTAATGKVTIKTPADLIGLTLPDDFVISVL